MVKEEAKKIILDRKLLGMEICCHRRLKLLSYDIKGMAVLGAIDLSAFPSNLDLVWCQEKQAVRKYKAETLRFVEKYPCRHHSAGFLL